MMTSGGRISHVTYPQSISVPNGTAFGSITFPSTVRAKRFGFWDDFAVTFSSTGYDGNTNGTYILNGQLTTYGNPVQIKVEVIPAPTQWADLIDENLMNYGIDNIDRIVTSASAKVGASIANAGTALLNRPSWNGDGVYFNTQGGLTWGTTSSHNTFHQDTPWSVYVVWYQLSVANTHLGPIVCANAGSSLNTGLAIFMDNRSASSRTYAINYLVTKGVSGQVPINVYSANNAVTPNAWNWLEARFDGTNFSLVVNGGTAVTSVPSIAFATGNATNALRIGNLNSITLGSGMNGYLKHIYMEDSYFSGADLTRMRNWATAMCSEGIPVEDANVYLLGGQSNMAGRGVNSSIAAPLNGRVGARIMVVKPTPPTQTDGTGSVDSQSYWDELQLGVNNTFESLGTQHGMEMRFGYNMWQYNHNAWLIKMGVGGTPLQSTATYNDWNVSSAQLYTQWRALILNGLVEMQHVFRKNPIIRGWVWMQGETDAIPPAAGAGAAYKGNFTTLFHTMIDTIVSAGYPVDKLRLYMFRITNSGSPGYDMTEFNNIYAAQSDIGDNYLTDNPSRSANVKGTTWRTTDDLALLDLQHYNTASLDTMGQALFNYFKEYVKE